MNLLKLLKQTNFEKSLLIGYYGGGNYGDELLLEVLQNLFKQQGVKDLTIAYQRCNEFETMHKNFGYKLVSMHSKTELFRALIKNKNVVIGGGGLWGLDMNLNTFLMSVFLFIARLLGKKVYLLGVGYYRSTTRLGHCGAFLAAKAATVILARDNETKQNFQRFSSKVYLDSDIAWNIDHIDTSAYSKELKTIEDKISVKQPTVFIALRHFGRHKNNFSQLMKKLIETNPKTSFIVALLESKDVDVESYEYIQSWKKQFHTLQALDFTINPLALYLFFKKHHQQLVAIAPQFHVIITAHLTGVPFLPVAYDNKVSQLFKQLKVAQELPIKTIQLEDIQAFVAARHR